MSRVTLIIKNEGDPLMLPRVNLAAALETVATRYPHSNFSIVAFENTKAPHQD